MRILIKVKSEIVGGGDIESMIKIDIKINTFESVIPDDELRFIQSLLLEINEKLHKVGNDPYVTIKMKTPKGVYFKI